MRTVLKLVQGDKTFKVFTDKAIVRKYMKSGMCEYAHLISCKSHFRSAFISKNTTLDIESANTILLNINDFVVVKD